MNPTLSAASYLTHTPELRALFDTMNQTRVALAKVRTPMPFRSPEYAASKAAYRAYWAAVDADKARA